MKSKFQFLVLILTILVAVFETHKLKAQQVVISKYRNVTIGDPLQEWTELLVIDDNTSLVGYSLRDNNRALNIWQSGVIFRDVSLWKNLRAGTVIVIHHRTSTAFTPDISANDGYIEVDAENTTLFNQVAPTDGTGWKDANLSVSETADIVQLRDATGKHVHALSHGTDIADYSALPSPKVQHNVTSNILSGSVVRVYPGQSIGEYSGSNPTNSKTIVSVQNTLARGFPNQGATVNDDLNSNFWRETRQPLWSSPKLNAVIISGKVTLSWNPMTDPNPSDNIQGYIVLSCNGLQSDTSITPQDGRVYTVGETIGSWSVLANITNSQTTSFDDANAVFSCGVNYKYRVFAYRFSKDETENEPVVSANPSKGRGRSYNETNFASATISRKIPAKPEITSSGALTFCNGKEVTLSTPLGSGLSFQWVKDGAVIQGAIQNSLTVNTEGIYKVMVANGDNCTNESDIKHITISSPPVAKIYASSSSICKGDTLRLLAADAEFYEWMKDGVTLSNAQNRIYDASDIGEYRVIVKTGGCVDTSQAFTITEKQISYSFSVPTIDYGKLTDCQSGKEQSVFVNNTSNVPISIQTIVTSSGFALVAPSLPFTIAAGENQEFLFQFSPIKAGITNGTADFIAGPCQVPMKLYLRGEKDQTKLHVNTSLLDFGTMLSCEAKVIDTTIQISNNGTVDMDITKFEFFPQNKAYTTTATFPIIVKPGKVINIPVRFTPGFSSSNSASLSINYDIGTCFDIFRVRLKAIVNDPAFVPEKDVITFKPLLGCDSYIDTIINLQNTSAVPIIINSQPADPNVRFLNLPFLIPPYLPALIAIRFQPLTQGNFSIPVAIHGDKCNDSAVITIKGSKQENTFDFNGAGIKFAEATDCQLQHQQTSELKLLVGGDVSFAKVSSITVHPPFSVDLVAGQSLSQITDIPVHFDPTSIGTFVDTVRFVFEPCGIVKSFAVEGKRTSTQFSVSTKHINFGIVDSGVVSRQKVVLRNIGSTPFTLKDIAGIVVPFSVLSTSRVLPVSILPNDSLVVIVGFFATRTIRDSISIDWVIDSPCDTLCKLTMIGNGSIFQKEPEPPDTLKTSMALTVGNGSAAVGQSVTFPITISGQKLDSAKIYGLGVKVTYNPKLLSPKGVAAAAPYTGFNASMATPAPGTTKIFIQNPDGLASLSYIQQGLLANFECEALLGNELTSPITISLDTVESIVLNSNTITDNSGVFTLSGDCDLNGRRVEIGGTVSLLQTSASNNSIGLEFETVSEERTVVSLYSINGIAIQTLVDKELPNGKHGLTFDTKDITNGVYFVILRSGISTKVLPVYIEK